MPVTVYGSFSISRPDPNDFEVRADRRLWITKDGLIVEDGDPRAAHLLAGAGGIVAPHDVKRLGLTMIDGKLAQPARQAVVVPATPKPEEVERRKVMAITSNVKAERRARRSTKGKASSKRAKPKAVLAVKDVPTPETKPSPPKKQQAPK